MLAWEGGCRLALGRGVVLVRDGRGADSAPRRSTAREVVVVVIAVCFVRVYHFSFAVSVRSRAPSPVAVGMAAVVFALSLHMGVRGLTGYRYGVGRLGMCFFGGAPFVFGLVLKITGLLGGGEPVGGVFW